MENGWEFQIPSRPVTYRVLSKSSPGGKLCSAIQRAVDQDMHGVLFVDNCAGWTRALHRAANNGGETKDVLDELWIKVDVAHKQVRPDLCKID